MSTFTQGLRESVAKSLLPPQQKNPLRTIGLSSLILELGLSDDELYEFCRDMAKDLVVHFHPDRIEASATVVEHQRRFAGAFEALKNRQVFDSALSEFKQQHNEEMSERSREHQIAVTQRGLLDETRTKLASAEDSVKNTNHRIDAMKDKFFTHLRLRGANLAESASSDLRATGIQQAVRLNLLVFDPYSPCTLPDKSIVRQFQEEYKLITSRRGWNKDKRKHFESSLRGKKVGGTRVQDLIAEALDSDELFPVINWSSADGYRKLGLTRFATGNHERRHRGTTPTETNLSIPGLSSLYRNALTSIGSLMKGRTEGVESLSVRFESIEVNRGFIKFGAHRYPILGSLRVEDINPLLFHLMASTDVPNDIILEKLQPLLIQGDLLVWQSFYTLHKLKKGKDIASQLKDAGKHLVGNSVQCVILEAIAGDFD